MMRRSTTLARATSTSTARTWIRFRGGAEGHVHSQSDWNLTGYANPRIDALLEKIKMEMVTYARDAYLEEAWQIVTDDLVYLPIRHGVSVFAMREDLEIPPDPWDVPRFRMARLKESGG